MMLEVQQKSSGSPMLVCWKPLHLPKHYAMVSLSALADMSIRSLQVVTWPMLPRDAPTLL